MPFIRKDDLESMKPKELLETYLEREEELLRRCHELEEKSKNDDVKIDRLKSRIRMLAEVVSMLD